MKKIKLIYIALVFVLLGLTSCAEKNVDSKEISIYALEGQGDIAYIENDYLSLQFEPSTAEIILTEKATGTMWYSNPENALEDPNADPVTKQYMQSQFTLMYADDTGNGMTLDSYKYSVSKGMYNYEVKDNTIEVNYTVGDIAKVYILPPAAPESRLLEFLEQMEASDRKKVEASYRLYDITKLRANDDKDSLLATYPDLENEKVYVLRDATQSFMLEQMENLFALAGYTDEDYEEDLIRYGAQRKAEKPGFNVSLRYELDGNSLLVDVPFDKVSYKTDYPITKLTLLPYFGAGSMEDEGYMMVPDGSGALIHFNNGRGTQLSYNNNVYGWDDGIYRDVVVNDNKAPYPVFGIQKNGAAFMSIIEEGDAYAHIRADVSGSNSSYNSVSSQFTMLHGASMDIASKSDRTVVHYESSLPIGEHIVQRFIPCKEPGYVGMGKQYRQYLQEKYDWLGKSLEGNVPIAVEVVGAVDKVQHIAGIPTKLPLKVTSYKETESMIKDFSKLGWENVQIKLLGWFNDGVEHSIPSNVNLVSELGSETDFKNLIQTTNESQYDLYLEGDFFNLYKDKGFDNFSLYKDAARYVNREWAQSYPYSFVWYGEYHWGENIITLARPAYSMSLIDGFKKEINKYDVNNIAFRSIGSRLGADYNEKRPVSRQVSENIRIEKMNELYEAGTGMWVDKGYSYTVPYTNIITDLALTDQGYGITDESVPFYQIALHGLVPYTGQPLNLAEDYKRNLLRTVETGAGLYFNFMKEETSILQDTNFREYYANTYDLWINDADKLYQRFTNDFENLYNQTIEAHETLEKGITLTQYDDGTKVVVNASTADYNYRGVTVLANDYVVIREGDVGYGE